MSITKSLDKCNHNDVLYRRKGGGKLKKTPYEVIYARVAPEVVKALKEMAFEEERSMSNTVERILRRYLEGVGKLPKENRLPVVGSEQAA
jgi:hypothetical protein